MLSIYFVLLIPSFILFFVIFECLSFVLLGFLSVWFFCLFVCFVLVSFFVSCLGTLFFIGFCFWVFCLFWYLLFLLSLFPLFFPCWLDLFAYLLFLLGFILPFPLTLSFYICVLDFNFCHGLCLLFAFCFVLLLCTSSLVLGTRLGVEPRPLWWEHQVQASGKPKGLRPQVILINVSFPPLVVILAPRPNSTQLPARSSVVWLSPSNQQDRNTVSTISENEMIEKYVID